MNQKVCSFNQQINAHFSPCTSPFYPQLPKVIFKLNTMISMPTGNTLKIHNLWLLGISFSSFTTQNILWEKILSSLEKKYEKMVKCFTDEERTFSSAEHNWKASMKGKGKFSRKKVCARWTQASDFWIFIFFYFEPIMDKPRVHTHTHKNQLFKMNYIIH